MSDYNIDDEVMQELRSSTRCGPDVHNKYVAMKCMLALIDAGVAEIIMLKDDTVRTYWEAMLTNAKQRGTQRKINHRKYELAQEAYDLLTAEERKILRVRKPVKPADYDNQTAG
jgi:hypothetical protein